MEYRRCAHCQRRYLWRESWPNQLCPRCHRLLERAGTYEAKPDTPTSSSVTVGPEKTPEGQVYLPGCGPLQGRLV